MAYIDNVIERERNLLRSRGFDSNINVETIVASEDTKVVHTGNSIYILSAIIPDENAIQGQDSEIAIYSPTANVCGLQMKIADMGDALKKVFKESIVIRKSSTDYPTEITFIKITPIQ